MTSLPLLDLHHLGHRQTGNESWARSLAEALFSLGGPGSYDVAVSACAAPEDLAVLPAREKVTVSSSSAVRLGLDIPRAMRRLGTTAVLVQYTAPAARVPAVVAVHDLSFEDARASSWLPLATRLRYRATIRASVHRASHVLAISACTRDDLIHRYDVDPARVSVVHAAVDPRFAEVIRRTPEDRTGPLTVLTVGNVLPRKNLQVLARGVYLLRSRGIDVSLRVAGTVHRTGRRDADLARRLLGAHVHFTGYLSWAQLAGELRTAQVLAFPSLFEGFGIPVLEAMVAGLPVVVSDRTSLPEVAGDAGLIAPADDPRAWADALELVVAGGRADDLRTRGLLRAAEFSWGRSAAIVRDVLAEVAGGSPGKRYEELA